MKKINIIMHIFVFSLVGLILFALEYYLPYNSLPEALKMLLYIVLFFGTILLFFLSILVKYLSRIIFYKINGYTFKSKQKEKYRYY